VQLRREVNFIQEGQNAERVAKHFAHREDLKVASMGHRWISLASLSILTALAAPSMALGWV